jgi:hypothetical protein
MVAARLTEALFHYLEPTATGSGGTVQNVARG